MIEEKGYLATDGTFVPPQPLPDLPDGKVDLDCFRQSARAAAIKAAGTSYNRLFTSLDHAFDIQDVMPKGAHEKMSAPLFRRIESVLIQARTHRENTAEKNADALIDCVMSPETAGAFQSLLPRVLGFPPLTYANGYASIMERENPWVLRLLESLPPARLVPVVSGGLPKYLFDPFRPFFHEPSLVAFLNGPFGDLRYLEGTAPLSHNPIDLGLSREEVAGAVFRQDEAVLRKLRKHLAKLKRDSPPAETIVSEVLGVNLKVDELEEFGSIGALFEKAARETRPLMPTAPFGAFAAFYLRYGSSQSGLTQLPSHVLGRYLSEHFDTIDLAFGLDDEISIDHGYQPHFATELLRHLPKTPNRYKNALFRSALGKTRRGRVDAQRLLKGAQGLSRRLEKSLNARGKDERLQAAQCLGRSGGKTATDTLTARIAVEKNVEVKNGCLGALKSLGVDISAFGLNRAELINEARVGLGKSLPEKRTFLADLEMPNLIFDDGRTAPLELAPWLVRYAADLGLPSHNELLALRLGHLDKGSRVVLARAVLEGWVRHDTLMWKEMRFETHRAIFEREMYKTYLKCHGFGVSWHRHRYEPGKPPKTAAEHAADISPAEVKEFLRNKTAWGGYLFSSYDAKGVLALCGALPVSEIRKTLRFYLKNHSGRSAQIKALMSVLASYQGKTPVNEFIRIAETQKQKTLKQHAIDLLDDLSHPYSPPIDEQSAPPHSS